MGFFSSKKTYVSSTLYNLAGDEEGRPNYLKSLIVGNVITNSKFSIPDTLRSGYIRGPGIKMRSFFRWALDNYDGIGVPVGSLGGVVEITPEALAAEIPHAVGETVRLQSIDVGTADYAYWADQWMIANNPHLLSTDWTSDIDEVTGQIHIQFADTTTVSFTPVGFEKGANYLYAAYSLASTVGEQAVVEGSDVIITPTTDPFPTTTGYGLISDTSSVNGDGNTVQLWVYEKVEYAGGVVGSDYTYSVKTILRLTEVKNPANELIQRKHRTDTQEIIHTSWSETRVFIYKIGGDNPVLNDLIAEGTEHGEYVPFIPIRLDNQFLSESFHPESYVLAKKAYKKASGGDLDKIIEKIADNEELGEIDYAYIVYGVPLNTKDNSAKEYLFRFFERIRLSQTTTQTSYNAYVSSMTDQYQALGEWSEWYSDQLAPDRTLYGEPAPFVPLAPERPSNNVRIRSQGALNTNLDLNVSWQLIKKTTGAGLKKPGAKRDEYWVSLEADPYSSTGQIYAEQDLQQTQLLEATKFTINHQIDEDNWETLTVYGAVHENLIYDNKSVLITAKEALEDTDESGFIIPIHYLTMKEMSLVASTQMATTSSYILFNSYKVVKKKWYQTGIFKIFVLLVIIAVAIAFPPLGGAAIAGWATLGAAVGLSGLIGIVVGGIIASIVTMLFMKALTAASTAVLGEKFGQMFAVVAAFAMAFTANGLANGLTVGATWGTMMAAPNLLQLTMVVGNAVSGYVQASAQQAMQNSVTLREDYNKESEQISQQFAQTFGYDTGVIDPMSLTDSSSGNFVETSSQFLSRTLMTGTDIAELSMDMLNNFTVYTLRTDLPLT